MSSHVRRYENEDEAYDAHRQRLVDAESEGEQAGIRQIAAGLCPYDSASPDQLAAWHRGRLRTLISRQRTMVSA